MIETVLPQDLGLDESELSICRHKWVSGDGMTEIGCRLGVVTDMCQAGGHILAQEVRKSSVNSIALASLWATQATALEVTPNCEPQAHIEVAGEDTAAGRYAPNTHSGVGLESLDAWSRHGVDALAHSS